MSWQENIKGRGKHQIEINKIRQIICITGLNFIAYVQWYLTSEGTSTLANIIASYLNTSMIKQDFNLCRFY